MDYTFVKIVQEQAAQIRADKDNEPKINIPTWVAVMSFITEVTLFGVALCKYLFF